MRRYLDYRPLEVARIFRMLDLIAHGAAGHGPVHLLLISAAEIGFAWDGEQQGWIRAALPPRKMLTGPIQHCQGAIFEAWQLKVSPQLAEIERSFGVLTFWTSVGFTTTYLFPPAGKK